MSWERIFAHLFGGFMCKLYAVAFAVWIAYEAATFVRGAFAAVNKGFANG